MRDKNQELIIEGEVEISDREKEFILGEGQWMMRQLVWKEKFPQVPTYRGQVRIMATKQIMDMIDEADRITNSLMDELKDD